MKRSLFEFFVKIRCTVIIVTSDNEQTERIVVSVCVGVLCLFTENITQKPVEGRETVEEAFSCTPPEIVSAAKEPECTLSEHGLLFKNRNYCTFNVNIVNN
jgi:hypothetical protein